MGKIDVFSREYCLGCIHTDSCIYKDRLIQFGNSECIITKSDRYVCSRYKKKKASDNLIQSVIFDDYSVVKYDVTED